MYNVGDQIDEIVKIGNVNLFRYFFRYIHT